MLLLLSRGLVICYIHSNMTIVVGFSLSSTIYNTYSSIIDNIRVPKAYIIYGSIDPSISKHV